MLLMILQRYTFGSKSQLLIVHLSFPICCLWYCKDIHLEANHNFTQKTSPLAKVAYDIAKIYIWKQITTPLRNRLRETCCLWYCKDIHLEANHNKGNRHNLSKPVAYDIAKIYIWKQITTTQDFLSRDDLLLMILQRYTFGSKSQR